MRVIFQGKRVWGCGLLGAVAWVGLCGAAETRARPKLSPWDAAVEARRVFEAEAAGVHTKVEYARVMDGFRAIYHGDPSDVHAARAVEQVAELLTEQGRELNDKKSLQDAAGQYAFLTKEYPQSGAARESVAAEKVVASSPVVPSRETGHPVAVASALGVPSVPRREARPEQLRSNAIPDITAGSKDRSPGGPDLGSPLTVTREAPVKVAAAPVAEKPVEEKLGVGPVAMVTGIRHWSTPTYTRVAIDLAVDGGDDVTYQAARVENPDRIFFDLHHAKLAPQLAGKSFGITDDGFLTKIRAAQFSDEVTRVVLDVHEVGEYSAFLLPNPERLIIDIHGRQGGARDERSEKRDEKDLGGGKGAEAAVPVQAPVASAVVPVAEGKAEAVGAVESSSLPPMPVTDGGAGLGLAVKPVATGTKTAEARVVIPSKPTVAKPVPNTVTAHVSDNGTDVAAVSEQPGKVEATSRPTSQPISSKSRDERSEMRDQPSGGDHYRPRVKAAVADGNASGTPTSQSRDVGRPAAKASAAPVEAAAPTAEGETSLVRALGWKIGRIVIDAGHGGHDSGTLGAGGIEEKDVVLDVALRLGKLLHDRLGAEIVYTRADDTFIPLETRTAIANKAQADLFISVHANSSPEASARGVEVYYLNFTSDPEAMRVAGRENAVSTQSVHELSDLVKKIALKDKIDESRELASDVDASLYAGLKKGNEGLKDRGVKKAPFVVLIGANMPSILAEISFVTNPEDAEQLQMPEYRERVAESLYGGVAKYAAGVNGVPGVPGAPGSKAKGRVTERAAR
jgi:N-acetylmuramoyl-L-alanine amidase